MRALAYTTVTTAIVLLFALAEWGAERFMSESSRAASTAVEIGIVLVATLLFRPIHQRVEAAIEGAFNRRKHHALAAMAKFRHELTSFNDLGQLLRRVIEAVEHHLEARACAIYLHRAAFRAEASSYDVPALELPSDDPLLVRLRTSGVPAQLAALKSAAPGSHAFPITAAGELIGILCVDATQGAYDDDEIHMLAGLASDLAGALVTLDPHLRPQKNRPANNLPADLPPLIGRDRALGEIAAALAQSRLLTITGSGGVGKTRVALHYAASQIEHRENGAWFVDLAPIASAAPIVPTILAALGAGGSEQEDQLEYLLEYLRPRDLLLVIDNCEHLVAGVAAVLARILSACPNVTLIATSRELLHLAGERVYRLAPLAPEAAAELFAERAAAVAPGFAREAEHDAVYRICERLDGIPLAIELAAARIRTLSAAEILAHLDERFRLLTSGSHTASPRQQTLAATIAWSYELLIPEEQSIFLRLAAFRGSFSLAAAAALCGDGQACDEYHVLDTLTSLVDKSLLTVSFGLTTRYRLLETIRAFAAEKSLERAASSIASDRHAAYFAGLASAAYHEFDTRPASDWLERLAADVDNFRAALSWTLQERGDRGTGTQLAADCGPIFLRMELLMEGLFWSAIALATGAATPAVAGRLAYGASMMQNNLGQNEAALASAQRAVSSYRETTDRRGRIRALSQEAQLLSRAHRFESAEAPAREAIEEARSFGDASLLVAVLRRCAFSLPPSEIKRARALFDEAAKTASAARNFEEESRVLEWWASREAGAECYDRAIELASQAIAHGSDHMPYLEVSLTGYALAGGRLDVARAHARKAVIEGMRAHQPLVRALAIAYWSSFHAAVDAEAAAVLFGYATRQLLELRWEGERDDRLALQTATHAIEAALDQERFAAAVERGTALEHGDALSLVTNALARGDAAEPALVAGNGGGALLR